RAPIPTQVPQSVADTRPVAPANQEPIATAKPRASLASPHPESPPIAAACDFADGDIPGSPKAGPLGRGSAPRATLVAKGCGACYADFPKPPTSPRNPSTRNQGARFWPDRGLRLSPIHPT